MSPKVVRSTTRPSPTGCGRQTRASCATRVLAVLLLLALPGDAARAQESEQPEDPWHATAELSFTDASGNQELQVLTTGLLLERDALRVYGLQLKVQARYGSSDDEAVFENYKTELNVDLAPASNRWSPFINTTAERDAINRLGLRVESGAGAKYRISRSDRSGQASLSIALAYSYESLVGPEPPDPSHRARWSLRLNGRQEVRDGVTINHNTQFRPIHQQFDDYLLSTETTLKVMVTSRVALSVSHEFDRNNEPPTGVQKNDRLMKAGILVEL